MIALDEAVVGGAEFRRGAEDPCRSALVVCVVRPRNIVSFASSALRSISAAMFPSNPKSVSRC